MSMLTVPSEILATFDTQAIREELDRIAGPILALNMSGFAETYEESSLSDRIALLGGVAVLSGDEDMAEYCLALQVAERGWAAAESAS